VALIELCVSRFVGKLRSNNLLTPKVDIFNVDDMFVLFRLTFHITSIHINSNTSVEKQVVAHPEKGGGGGLRVSERGAKKYS
jgi:hypothetical protein